ncbi:type II secretion system F family protein [Kineococcus sp. SYSU DK003]|uniref:type II secretion system F family protein n=1 Tax=Kineococcus sp. SYSU DK003 TaxID=3383124 RepID=UPI003D7E2B44
MSGVTGVSGGPLAAATAGIAGAAFGLGVLALVLGLRRTEPTAAATRTAQRRRLSRHRLRHLLSTALTNPARMRVLGAGVAAVAGALVWLFTGWVIAIVVLPGAALVLPALLGRFVQGDVIDKLEALDEWTRNLAALLGVGGIGLEQAITASRGSCPKAIAPQVALLVARLAARTPTETALREFADDIDDSTGDLIASALILASLRRSEGVVMVLEGLAQTVGDEVRMRREIEADRAKPRTTARLLTLLSVGVLAVLSLNGTYLEPYKQGLGQVLLLALLSAYAGCLFWLQRMSRTRRTPRFLSTAYSTVTTSSGSTSPIVSGGSATMEVTR